MVLSGRKEGRKEGRDCTKCGNCTNFIYCTTVRPIMARAKTASFTLTHDLVFDSVNPTGIIPIGSLIDVGDAQALEIEKVDYVFTGHYQSSTSDYWTAAGSALTADSQFLVQLMDKNQGETINPADNNLIASGQMHFDSNNVVSAAADFYPDDFRNSTGRFVVNDEMYIAGRAGYAYGSNYTIVCTVRITAKVVKLVTRDWMAISLETVQNE